MPPREPACHRAAVPLDSPDTPTPTRDRAGDARHQETATAHATTPPLSGPGPRGETPIGEVSPASSAPAEGSTAVAPAPEFCVVGIGASAGGLEAIAAVLRRLAVDSLALVVVQHLAPDHESALTEILARATAMPVLTAHDGARLEPNHVYVAPPSAELGLFHGVLRVFPRDAEQAPHLPIDAFFRSLADDAAARAIGVVLSGTGTDGTQGLRSIKAAGGITFVQEPSTARYDGMPRSALESGAADFCLSPEALADELARVSTHPYGSRAGLAALQPEQTLDRLFLLVRRAFGTDLSSYKPAMVDRRIQRRMALQRVATFDDYVRLCESQPRELRTLHNDLLVNVTSFFRDREPFDDLKTRVFPGLLDRRDARPWLRVWVPACSTGEEAYSIGICLLEVLERRPREVKVQIFATDLDEAAIQVARRGIYPESIALDVSPNRLSRFFTKQGHTFQVLQRLRELVVFSVHDLNKDPPFSRLDLVSCRNLLIYMQPAVQKRILRTLHRALNPGGFLLLGTSETVGPCADLFSLLSRSTKLYANKQVALGAALEEGTRPPGELRRAGAARVAGPTQTIQQIADRKVLEAYGPPGVLVNETLEILQFRGRTGRFLDPAPGVASFNLLKLARPELNAPLRVATHTALAEDRRVVGEAQLQDADGTHALRLDVVPMRDPATGSRCLLVLFGEVSPPREPARTSGADGAVQGSGSDLERELRVTKESLQGAITDLETTNEEVQAANEELQSANEELQSTNEELETSKEELQATNEELTTLNDELHSRITELGQANDDLHNVLLGVEAPVVIVGLDLRIRRFTAGAERLLGLTPADVGRSVRRLDAFLGVSRMEETVSTVIAKVATHEQEVLAVDNRWHALRIAPYQTLDHSIRGAVVTIADIDARKRAADQARHVGEYAAEFLSAVQHPLAIVDDRQRVTWVNGAFRELFQVAAEEVTGMPLSKVGQPGWEHPRLSTLVGGVLALGPPFRGQPIRHVFPDAGEVELAVSGSLVPFGVADATAVLLSFEGPFPSSRPSPGGGPA